MPSGLTGLVLAGLVAAIMSTVDSTLNSSSTLVVHDFITKPEEPVEPTVARKYGTLCTLTFMIIAVIVAPLIQHAGGIWQYLQQAFSIIVPPVVAVFFLGAISRRMSERSAFATLLSMHALGVILFALGQLGVWPLHYTVTVAVMTVASCLLHWGLSATVLPPRETAEDDLIWTPSAALARAEGTTGGLLDVRVWGAVLAITMAVILVMFW